MYYWYINEPVGNQKLYEQLHVRMFEKAADVELSCYENPVFFNKYMKATAQIKTRAYSVLWAVSSLLAELLGTAYLLYRTMRIDRLTILFAIVPLISTYLLGTRVNRATYDLYQENMEAERTKDYRMLALTVAENVVMGEAEEGDRERIRQALKDSGAYEKGWTLSVMTIRSFMMILSLP